jgi:DNA-binding NarL/FixJ family response regulator
MMRVGGGRVLSFANVRYFPTQSYRLTLHTECTVISHNIGMSNNYTESVGEAGTQHILIIETSRALRIAMSRWLEAQMPHCRILVSDSLEGALGAGRVSRPRLVIMDMRLDGSGGGAAIRSVKRALPGADVVIFTHFDAAIYRKKALEAGASGYALKRNPERDLMPLVRHVFGEGGQRAAGEIEGIVVTSNGDKT